MTTNYGGPIDYPDYDTQNTSASQSPLGISDYFEYAGTNKEIDQVEVRRKRDTLSKKRRGGK